MGSSWKSDTRSSATAFPRSLLLISMPSLIYALQNDHRGLLKLKAVGISVLLTPLLKCNGPALPDLSYLALPTSLHHLILSHQPAGFLSASPTCGVFPLWSFALGVPTTEISPPRNICMSGWSSLCLDRTSLTIHLKEFLPPSSHHSFCVHPIFIFFIVLMTLEVVSPICWLVYDLSLAM